MNYQELIKLVKEKLKASGKSRSISSLEWKNISVSIQSSETLGQFRGFNRYYRTVMFKTQLNLNCCNRADVRIRAWKVLTPS